MNLWLILVDVWRKPARYCKAILFQLKKKLKKKKVINYLWTLQVMLVVKNPHATVGDIRDAGSIPGWGRSPGGGNGNPLQRSHLENSTHRGAWRAMVHGIAKSWT